MGSDNAKPSDKTNPVAGVRQRVKRIAYALAPVNTKRYALLQQFIEVARLFRPINRRYQKWIARFDTLNEDDVTEIRRQIETMPEKPLISIIMPVYNPDLRFLKEAIQSVQVQLYPHWELCIADDASKDPQVQQVIEDFAQHDVRIRVIFREANGHISAASNSALSLASGAYLALLDHDDQLHPAALFEAARVICAHPDCEIVYSDEDKLTRTGKRVDPYFKTGFDHELFLCHNMVIHLGVYKHSTVMKIGGFRVGVEGSQDYDLVLRMIDQIHLNQIYHIPRVLYHWRISPRSAAGNVNIKPYAAQAGVQALNDYFERNKIRGHVTYDPQLAVYQPYYHLPDPPPTVDVLLYAPTISPRLAYCVRSLLTNTSYPSVKVRVLSVDGNGAELETFLGSSAHDERLEIGSGVHAAGRESALNALASATQAEYICLLQPDVTGFTSGWLGKMVGQALQPGIGAVGVKLTQPNGRIFSNGIVLGVNGIVTHLFRNRPQSDPGYLYWAMLQKGYSALSAACLLMKTDYFQRVGGFDVGLSAPDLADVDLCLKLREMQLRNVLIPSITLKVPLGRWVPAPLGRCANESVEVMRQRWGTWLEHDPSFNPNLTQTERGKITVNLNLQRP